MSDKPDNFDFRKPSDTIKQDLTTAVAQLRHGYQNLKAGTVVDQASFADGLIAPQIERIERVLRRFQ